MMKANLDVEDYWLNFEIGSKESKVKYHRNVGTGVSEL